MGQGNKLTESTCKEIYHKNLSIMERTEASVRAYFLAIYEIKETLSYRYFYSSWQKFLQAEAPDLSSSTFNRFCKAENVRRNLVDKKVALEQEVFPESHLVPIARLTDKQQVVVFEEVHEKAKKQKRLPTANDYKVAAEKYAKKKEKKKKENESLVIDGEVIKKSDKVLEGYIKKGEPYCCPTCNGTGQIVPDENVMLELATPEFFEAWAQWLSYRKDRKLPKYARPQMLLKKLAAMGHDNAIAAIELAITQNWNGVHERAKMEKQEKKSADWEDYLEDV